MLAWVAIAQFAALAVQAAVLFHHGNLIKKSVCEMKKTVSAYQDFAESTRQSLSLTHRPQLRVFGVHLHGGMNTVVQPGDRPSGEFRIVNVGGTKAKVKNVFATAIITKNLPMAPLYEGKSGDAADIDLAPGESMTRPFKHDDGVVAEGHIPTLRNGGTYFFVLGRITYTDAFDPPVTRQTLFCRYLNYVGERFVTVDDPDYERAD